MIHEVNSTSGYLNFKASPNWLAKQVVSGNIRTNGGDGKLSSRNKSVLIEHTSANPNGPFHVGRARNAILGDTLVRLNRLYGNDVRAEYYVDDMGKQVAVLAWALDNLTEKEVEKFYRIENQSMKCGRTNPIINESDGIKQPKFYVVMTIPRKRLKKPLLKWFTPAKTAIKRYWIHSRMRINQYLDGMLDTLGRLRITFDEFTKESMFVTNGDVSQVMEQLARLDIHGIADNGAEFLDLGARGLKGKTEFSTDEAMEARYMLPVTLLTISGSSNNVIT